MSLKRGPSKFWASLFRMKLVRGHMPFWRVVVEAKLDRRARHWPAHAGAAVTAVFVWARTIEEAEALAALALSREGLEAVTADAVKCPPAAAPKKRGMAVSRGELLFLAREEETAPAPPKGARA